MFSTAGSRLAARGPFDDQCQRSRKTDATPAGILEARAHARNATTLACGDIYPVWFGRRCHG